ncbi:hypothetical protein AWV80_16305 [Cupriavidus sp. UYMU48A]|nr:hypothetical protein AWV80_16305 [Cupriavidus sp. UYMU48A]
MVEIARRGEGAMDWGAIFNYALINVCLLVVIFFLRFYCTRTCDAISMQVMLGIIRISVQPDISVLAIPQGSSAMSMRIILRAAWATQALGQIVINRLFPSLGMAVGLVVIFSAISIAIGVVLAVWVLAFIIISISCCGRSISNRASHALGTDASISAVLLCCLEATAAHRRLSDTEAADIEKHVCSWGASTLHWLFGITKASTIQMSFVMFGQVAFYFVMFLLWSHGAITDGQLAMSLANLALAFGQWRDVGMQLLQLQQACDPLSALVALRQATARTL